jgi:hypothetical protein
MPFNTTSYFAGVGTVCAAITLGFAGGFVVSNSTQKVDGPNRIERVAASTPLPNPPSVQAAASVPKPDTAAVPDAAAPAPAPAPQSVAQQQPPPAQEQLAQQPAAGPVPVVAKDDAAEQVKTREAELRAAERKRAQHRKWAERQRHQQELDAATAQVRHLDRGEDERVVQRDPIAMPRFGLFGGED